MGSVEEIYESEIHRTITRRTSFKIHEVRIDIIYSHICI